MNNLLNFRNDENLFDQNQNYGPLELNILEKIENSLADNNLKKNKKKKNTNKYQEKKILFIKGWIDTESVFQRYTWGFISKILISIAIILTFQNKQYNMIYITGILCFINLSHFIKNLIFFLINKKKDSKQIFILFYEIFLSFSYFFTYLGYFFLSLGIISKKYLVLYCLPYFLFTICLFFYNSRDNFVIAQSKFLICESFQFILISLKISGILNIKWKYILLCFLSASFYLLIVGVLILAMFFCALLGIFFNCKKKFILKSMYWLQFYYIWSGGCYLFLMISLIEFFEENSLEYIYLNSECFYNEKVVFSGYLIFIFSILNLIIHLYFAKSVRKYLKEILFKKSCRKEIFINFYKNSNKRLFQKSDYYFLRNQNVFLQKKDTSQVCAICFNGKIEILFSPCNHAIMCRYCFIYNLKYDIKKIYCPICKKNARKIYYIEFNTKLEKFFIRGKILVIK